MFFICSLFCFLYVLFSVFLTFFTCFLIFYLFSYLFFSGHFTFFTRCPMLITPVLSNAAIRAGIKRSCKMIPGIALKHAPAINICHVKTDFDNPIMIMLATPQTTLPPIIAMNKERYKAVMQFQRERL